MVLFTIQLTIQLLNQEELPKNLESLMGALIQIISQLWPRIQINFKIKTEKVM